MSSRRIADLVIKIGADSYEFKQKTREVEQGLDGLTNKLDKVGKEMSLKLTAPLMAVSALSVGLYDTQAKAEAKVKQAIIATGGAAKLTFQELADIASEFQSKSIFGDEKILNDSTAKLLTFTNIAGQNFKRTQAAVLDLSTAMDMDLKSATIAVGKALNNPVKGLSSLSRIGITFTKEQENLIRNFAETNRLGEAQTVILGELEKKFKGQAQAAAKEGIGALQQLKNSWGDFLERIGQMLMPFINRITQTLQVLVDKLQTIDPRVLKLTILIGGLAAATGPALIALGSLVKIIPLLKAGFELLVSPIALVRTAIAKLTLAISTNPIGLLLTALSAGVTLFMAFSKGAKDSADTNGELTNQVIEESRQVNILIGKLTSSTTAAKERKDALDELKRIQPEIVQGLSDESTELETLTKRALAYNQQLVLRIALARKQDQVAAALEKQTEAGIRKAEKEAALYKEMANLAVKLQSGKIQIGTLKQAQGITKWREVTEFERSKIIESYNDIMASGDSLWNKASKISALFHKHHTRLTNYRGVDTSNLRSIVGEIKKIEGAVAEAASEVEKAESDVNDFAEAFASSLNTATIEAVGTSVVDSLSKIGETTRKSIEDLNVEIQELEKQKSKSFDPEEITEFNRRIDALKKEMESLNNLGRGSGIQGRLSELNSQLKKVEERKLSTFDTNVIAKCNEEIAALKKEIEYLNKVLPVDLIPRAPLESVFLDELSKIQPVVVPLKMKIPKLNSPFAKLREQMNMIRTSVQDEMFGWIDRISGRFKDDIKQIESFVKTYTDALIDKGWTFEAALDYVGTRIRDTMKAFDESLSNFLANSISSAAEAIGQIVAGDLGFGGLLKAILLQFANFLKQIGQQLIQFGVMIVAFKSALKSVLANPWGAIAVGAAMVTAASAMTALINKNARKNIPKLAKGGLAFGATYAMVGDNPNAQVDPEVIAPLSKLKDMMGNGSMTNIAIQLSGELTAKGRDLVYVLGRENFKQVILG